MTIRFFPSKVIFADQLHHVATEMKQSIRLGGLFSLGCVTPSLLHVIVKFVTRLTVKIKLVWSCFREIPVFKDMISYFHNSQYLK